MKRLNAGLNPHDANAFIESFCLHARALAAFFAGHAVDQDLRVNDYAPGFRGTLEPKKKGKAAALEAYYRQARNLEAEREAANVRLRAERRAGELLKELARATPEQAGAQGGRGNEKSMSNDATGFSSPYATALADTGMSRQTAHRYQQLADMPRGDFEAALAGPEKPYRDGKAGHFGPLKPTAT